MVSNVNIGSQNPPISKYWGGTGNLFFHSWPPVKREPAINVDMVMPVFGYIFKKTNNCWGVLQHNSPKHDPCLKDACIFIEKLKWRTSTMKKH